MKPIWFSIQGLPKTTNSMSRQHWRTKAKEAKHWKWLVWGAVCTQKPEKPFKHAMLTLTRHSSSEPDYDGLVSSFKHIIDGLVESHVLIDDRMSNITSTYLWEKIGPKKGHITVKVEGIE